MPNTINLTVAQLKNLTFPHAIIREYSQEAGLFTVHFVNEQSFVYGVSDQQGNTKTYKSLATAAAFARTCGVHSLQVDYLK